MSLADKFIKNSKRLRGTSRLSDVFDEPTTYYDTGIPALNLAFSGDLEAGTQTGVTCIAGKSRTFKTLFGLISCKAYMDANPECFMLFYDSEGGASKEYFDSVGIDPERVIRVRIMNIEELKFDLMEKLEEIRKQHDESEDAKKEDEKEKFIVFVDSIGNLASTKEVSDALTSNSATDMGTRAKSLKAMFRIVTPYFDRCELQMVAINHTYNEMKATGAGKQVMSGGEGPMLSSNNVFIVGKRQIKDAASGKILGWEFILNAEKSRSIRERSAIGFEVKYGKGIDRYSGLLDMAIASGHVVKPKKGWFSRPSVEDDKNWRRAETSCQAFWEPILNDESFKSSVSEMYKLDGGDPLLQQKLDDMMAESDEELDKETGEILSR